MPDVPVTMRSLASAAFGVAAATGERDADVVAPALVAAVVAVWSGLAW